MENYTISMPAYTVGPDACSRIGSVCARWGSTAVVVGGKRGTEAIRAHLQAGAEAGGIRILDFVWYGGEASAENVEALCGCAAVRQAELIFGVGGGKAMDTAKALGEKIGRPVFTFPTIASNCAATTAVSILYHADGSFAGPHFLAAPAVHAFLDTGVLAAAPERYFWAGMGDTYAKYYEASLSARGEELPHYFAFGLNVSRLCAEPILHYGVQALAENRAGTPGSAFEQAALAVIVTTGVASLFLCAEHTVDYNSGLAHAIFYALTRYPQIERSHLHGEVVAYGVLYLLYLDGQYEELNRLFHFHKAVGLPTKLAEIEITPEQFRAVLPTVAAAGDIRHWPCKITEEMLLAANDALEAMN